MMTDHGTLADFVRFALIAAAVLAVIGTLAATMLSSRLSRKEEEWHGR